MHPIYHRLGENAAEKNLTGVFYALYARSHSHVQRLVPKCKDSSQKYSKIGPKYHIPLDNSAFPNYTLTS